MRLGPIGRGSDVVFIVWTVTHRRRLIEGATMSENVSLLFFVTLLDWPVPITHDPAVSTRWGECTITPHVVAATSLSRRQAVVITNGRVHGNPSSRA